MNDYRDTCSSERPKKRRVQKVHQRTKILLIPNTLSLPEMSGWNLMGKVLGVICLLKGITLPVAGQESVLYPDTLTFYNGRTLAAKVIDTLGYQVGVVVKHRDNPKKMFISKEALFSIRYGSGREQVYYFQDSLLGNELSVDDARMLIIGMQDAKKGYHATLTSAGGFAAGVVGGIFGSYVYGYIPCFFYSGIMTNNHVKGNIKSVRNINYIHNEYYRKGYASAAKKKRIIRSLLWGGVGVAVGTFIHYVLQNNTSSN